jgi:hypothetical protein
MRNDLPSLSLRTIALVSCVSLALTGCAPAEPSSAGDDETTEGVSGSSALGAGLRCDIKNLGSQACQDVVSSIGLQGYATGRGALLDRALAWVNAGVLYDGNASYQGWRKDCSGFVSMVWQDKGIQGTISLPPFNESGQFAYALPSFEDLVPGDAVNRKTRVKNKDGKLVGHVMLFAGWASFDHQEVFVIHEYSPGKPTAIERKSMAELADYVPIRSVKAPPVTTPAADPTPQDPAPADPAPSPGMGACGKMVADDALDVNQAATSCDGRFSLVLQDDGNLVLYQVGGKALWASSTVGSKAQKTVMQGDGNLVVYGAQGPIWSTNTWGHPGAWLGVGDDGSLILHDAGGMPIWWDGTGGL